MMIYNRALIAMGIVHATMGIWLVNAAYGEKSPASHPELETVKQYAPIIWLATDERLYPMLPHPFAFDGKDNDRDGAIDLQDVDEVNTFGVGNDWNRMSDRIEEFRQKDKLPPARVIYADPDDSEITDITLFQYWFYYLLDEGTGAHVHDGEHAYIFVHNAGRFDIGLAFQSELDVGHRQRISRDLWNEFGESRLGREAFILVEEEGSRWLVSDDVRQYLIRKEDGNLNVYEPEVKCIVAAGHTGASANNILIASNQRDKNLILPRRLAKHTPILVELGKHASAPDRGFDGRFDMGMDANVFYSEVWGSRDLAAGVGTTKIDRMTPEYSFPRDVTTLIPESDWFKFARGMTILFNIDQNLPVRGEDGTQFIVESQFEEDLNAQTLPEGLVQKFQEYDIDLGEFEILIEPPKKWFIQTKDGMYLIQKIRDQLKVFAELDTELNKKKIPDTLIKAFQGNDIQLEEPSVSIVQKNKQWMIITENQRFRLQKRDDGNRTVFDVYDGYLEKEYPRFC